MDLLSRDVLASRIRLHRGRLFRRPDRVFSGFPYTLEPIIQTNGYAVQPGLVPGSRATMRRASSIVPPSQ